MGATRVALGFRAHSGWAAAVAVGGTPSRPLILDRRRIEIADRSIPGSVQPYHAAEELGLQKTRAFLKRCEQGSRRLAARAIAALVADVEAGGHTVAGCGLLLASGRPLPALDAILASHALIHTADGEHFREAIVRACQRRGFPVARVRERELYGLAAVRFRATPGILQALVQAAGKPLGPPWTADQKLAALVAWLALATRIPGGQGGPWSSPRATAKRSSRRSNRRPSSRRPRAAPRRA